MMRSQSKRLFPLDALRGLIIVFMALDHANYFIAQQHSSGEHWGGSFPTYNSALPFLTRLVTHFSAPGFFFLMGVGMLLFAESQAEAGLEHVAHQRTFLAARSRFDCLATAGGQSNLESRTRVLSRNLHRRADRVGRNDDSWQPVPVQLPPSRFSS